MSLSQRNRERLILRQLHAAAHALAIAHVAIAEGDSEHWHARQVVALLVGVQSQADMLRDALQSGDPSACDGA